MLQSVEIFLDFLGIELTLEGTLVKIDDRRLTDALLIHTHNHLRLRRFMACLSITGFRPLALHFIEFLRRLIESDQKYGRLQRVFSREW